VGCYFHLEVLTAVLILYAGLNQLGNLASGAVQAVEWLLFLCNCIWSNSPQLSLDVVSFIRRYSLSWQHFWFLDFSLLSAASYGL